MGQFVLRAYIISPAFYLLGFFAITMGLFNLGKIIYGIIFFLGLSSCYAGYKVNEIAQKREDEGKDEGDYYGEYL